MISTSFKTVALKNIELFTVNNLIKGSLSVFITQPCIMFWQSLLSNCISQPGPRGFVFNASVNCLRHIRLLLNSLWLPRCHSDLSRSVIYRTVINKEAQRKEAVQSEADTFHYVSCLAFCSSTNTETHEESHREKKPFLSFAAFSVKYSPGWHSPLYRLSMTICLNRIIKFHSPAIYP